MTSIADGSVIIQTSAASIRLQAAFADLDRDTLACYTKPDEVEKGPIHPLAL